MDNTSMVDLLMDRNKCLRLSPLSSCKNTIYYFIVCKMGMPHYNLKYSYWKRCSISRHHITAQTFCIPLIGPIPGLVMTGAGPPYLPPPPFAIWYIISYVVNLLTRSFTLCFVSKRIICRYYILEQPGLQKKFCTAEQDYFGGPGTGWDLSQNWEYEVQ